MIQKGFQALAKFIYGSLKKSRLSYLCFPKAVQRDIQILGKEEEAYYIRKLTYTGGLLVAGILVLLVYLVQTCLGWMSQVDHIDRPEAYEETQEIIVRTGRQDDVYHLEVAPVALTKEEADAQFQEVVTQIEHYILGENASLDAITQNLILPMYIEEYPFEIYWESDQEQLIDTAGNVNRVGLEEDSVVVLTAVFYYKDWIWEEQFGVLVCREVLTEEERYKRRLGTYLQQAEAEQRNEKTWTFPDVFQEETLSYQQVSKDYDLLLLAGLVLVAGAAVWIGQDYDLRAGRDKRQAIFQEEYITFVSSLSLYISAGLNLQTALQFCTRDYIKRKPGEHLLRIALQDMQKDMQNGYSFLMAVERFAAVTDDTNYRRLAGLLSQGLVNGAHGLSTSLEKEVEKVREEKRRQSKIKGEQISTALIAPMMLQLGIVIALIMLPAFTSMQF